MMRNHILVPEFRAWVPPRLMAPRSHTWLDTESNTLSVTATFQYRGPALRVRLTLRIVGLTGLLDFREMNLPSSSTFQSHTLSASGSVSAGRLEPGAHTAEATLLREWPAGTWQDVDDDTHTITVEPGGPEFSGADFDF